MIQLLRYFSWRHTRRHLLRTFLGLMSIALGVALFVSVEVALESTVRSFEVSVRRMAGKAELRVTRGRQIGVEIEVLRRIEEIPGAIAAPALQVSTTFVDLEEGPVLLLGVDFRREPKFREFSFVDVQVNPLLMAGNGAIFTKSLGARHGLKIGRVLRVNTPSGIRKVRVAGFVDDSGPARVFGGNIAVMGIGGVAKLFARGGMVDRIDVAGVSAEAVRGKLGPEYRVERVRGSSSIVEEVLSRIRTLIIISVIALLVGLFIVYLSVSIGVVERTKEVGTMRALGASRTQVLSLFLVEAGLLGLAGSAAGVAMGYGLARGLVDYAAESINAMRHLVHVEGVILPPWLLGTAVASGTLTAVLASLVPALRATGISPLEVLRPATFGFRVVRSHRSGFGFGTVLLLAGVVGVVWLYMSLPMWTALVCTALVFIGGALMLPQVTIWLSRLFRRPLRALFRIEGHLAADNVMKYPQRTSLTVIALAGALSIMVSSASAIASFRVSTETWMKGAFPWDLSVQATDLSQSIYSEASLPTEVFDRVRDVEGVGRAFEIQSVLQEYGDHDIMIVALDPKAYTEMMREAGTWTEGLDGSPESIGALKRGETVIVSTNFALFHGVRTGDDIDLVTPSGPRRFRVSSEIADYSWPQGSIALDLDVYRRLWKDTTIKYVDLRVAPGHDPEEVRARLGKALEGEYRAFVYSKEEVLDVGRRALEASFQLTHAQVVIAMVIGFLGIVNTLLISVLTRTREIGLVRAVGMTRAQVSRTVVIEAVFIAVVGCVIGVCGGLLATAYPISNHVMRRTGYTLPFVMPWLSVFLAFCAALLIGFVASVLPARRAAGMNLLQAISYE